MVDDRNICIASLLPSHGGNTGVQSFYNAFAAFARSRGIQVHLANPYVLPKILRGPLYRFGRLLGSIDREYSPLWDRMVHYILLRRVLGSWLVLSSSRKRVVFAQDPLSAKAALDLKDRGHRLEVVLVVHYNRSEAHEAEQDGLTREGHRLYRSFLELEKRVLPKVDRILFVSEFMRQQVLERLPEAGKVPHCVVPNFKPVAASLQERGGTAHDLITIGTLTPRKNHRFILEVLASARQMGKMYSLTLAGDGPLRRELEALSVDMKLRGSVHFMGHVENAGAWIPFHRAYVHAAHLENCPIVLIEALAAGKPLLAPAVGGIPEIFSHGVEGFFLNLSDPRESAESLIHLMEHPETYAGMAVAAQKRYEQLYSPQAAGPRWLNAVLGE